MYWSAEGMMMVAKGVTVIHHWRSFQSVQKSQSPANRSRVMSAAAATTKAAVNQNMKSHFRSMKRYLRFTRSRSSPARTSIAAACATLFLLHSRDRERQGRLQPGVRRPSDGRTLGGRQLALLLHGVVLDLVEA